MAEATTAGFTVKQSIEIEAPRERVWELLTTPEGIERWFAGGAFEARPGAPFELTNGKHVAFGEVTQCEPPRLIAYTWDWRNNPIGAPTEVRWELEEEGGRTTVRLTHTGFPSEELSGQHHHGWNHYADRLKTVGEGGDPGPDRMGQE